MLPEIMKIVREKAQNSCVEIVNFMKSPSMKIYFSKMKKHLLTIEKKRGIIRENGNIPVKRKNFLNPAEVVSFAKNKS